MMKNIRNQISGSCSFRWGDVLRQKGVLFFFLLAYSLSVAAQNKFQVQGKVLDVNDEPLIGATVALKGNTAVGTVADFDGNFVLEVPDRNSVLVVSYLGMTTQEIDVDGRHMIVVVLREDSEMLDEVVVVGYGQQKKASVVGAITQTTGKVLERAAGISDIGAALTGNLPGVITTANRHSRCKLVEQQRAVSARGRNRTPDELGRHQLGTDNFCIEGRFGYRYIWCERS